LEKLNSEAGEKILKYEKSISNLNFFTSSIKILDKILISLKDSIFIRDSYSGLMMEIIRILMGKSK
jgi:hypothetical protein